LTTIFAISLGAGITYTIQKKLHRESEKRSRNTEYVEKYYGPLLVEIQKNIFADISGHYNFQNLDSFKMLRNSILLGRSLDFPIEQRRKRNWKSN